MSSESLRAAMSAAALLRGLRTVGAAAAARVLLGLPLELLLGVLEGAVAAGDSWALTADDPSNGLNFMRRLYAVSC